MKTRCSLLPGFRLTVSTFWLAALVGLPACLGSTNVFLETFDRWPPAARVTFPSGGAAKATNTLGGGAVRLMASWPAVTGSTWAEVGMADAAPDIFRSRSLERRLDLVKFTGTTNDYVELCCYGFSAETLTSYLFLLGQQQIVLVKYLPHPGALARFICEDVTFPLEQLTLVVRFNPAGDTLSIHLQVLDKLNGDAVLFDRTVLDTPAQDSVSEAPWGPGAPLPNEDPGEPYLGGAYTWFAIMHYGPKPTTVEAVFDNYQTSTIGVGIEEFVGKVFTNTVGRTLPYRLFVPPTYDPANRYPLVLSLHGMGECGSDNRRQVEGQGFLAFASPENQQKQPCFLLAPQSPGDWMDVVDRVLDLITNLQTRYSIDPGRLYVTGLSMGGWGTFDYLAHRPDLFAAGVPMSCATGPASESIAARVPRIAQIPIWTFCGALDTDYDHIGDVRAMVDALTLAGGQPIYTEYSRGGHLIWADAYQTPGLFEWLMAQRRGSQGPDRPS